jgi:hypothetical protein
MQKLAASEGISRRVSSYPRAEDPAFDEYWRRKEQEIEAMTFTFSYPDAMLTLTFNNSWVQATGLQAQNASRMNLNLADLDSRFQSYKSMALWRQKLSVISKITGRIWQKP